MDKISFVIDKCRQPYFHINRLERFEDYYLSAHTHPAFWQVIIVTEGELTVECEGARETLSAGDVHILPSGFTHTLESMGYRQIGIDFASDDRRFDAVYSAFSRPAVLHMPSMLEFVRRIEELDAEDERDHELIFTLCDLILLSMARAVCDKGDPLKRRILDYISSHADECRVEDAAVALYMSSSHLERKCRELFGMGLAALAARKRFELACAQLVSTELRVRDIAELLGFSEVSNFSAFFKRFAGVSPAEYRRRYCR